MNLTQRNKQTILAVLGVIVLFGVLWMFSPRSNTIDDVPEGTSTNPDSQAVITDGEDLVQALGGVDAYDFLQYDLFFFAKTAYASYQDQESTVGFAVKSDIKNEDGAVIFYGTFGSVDNKITIVVKPLRNDRINVSITDTKTNLNIDTFLPSNNRRDQFIGTLPLTSDTYTIDYDSRSDGFIISLYPETLAAINAAYDEAEAKLKEGLGVTSLAEEIVQVSRPGSSFGL